MLGRYNAAVIEEALRATTTAPPFPSADDRPAWAAIGDRLGPAQVAEIVDRAEAAVQQPREVRQRWFRCGAGCLTLSEPFRSLARRVASGAGGGPPIFG